MVTPSLPLSFMVDCYVGTRIRYADGLETGDVVGSVFRRT